MDSEQFFHERPPEVEESHRKGSLIFGPQRKRLLVQELPYVRAEFHADAWFAAARRAAFQHHARKYFAGAAKERPVREVVAAAEPADGLTFRFDQCHGWVRGDSIAEFLKLTIDAVLSERGMEREGIEKQIDVF